MTIIMSYRTTPRSGLFETMILQHNTITKWSNQKYMSYVYFKSMHYRCRYLKPFGTAEKNENSVSKECILTLFGTAEIFVIIMSLKHVLWRYWKRFGTAEKSLKTMSLKHAFWRRTLVETVWNSRKNENNVSKECILMLF